MIAGSGSGIEPGIAAPPERGRANVASGMSGPVVARPGDRGRLPATVVGLGLVSLLTDASSEAIFPLLPAFLVTLGASNSFIGVIEGAADLVASVLKYLTGRAADRRARMKPVVLAGYGISTVVRPLVAFATGPWQVLAVRVADRVGKGVRTAPRDALISLATAPGDRARAFGFHRAMDHLGAALGTVLALGLLWLHGAPSAGAASAEAMRSVFLWAAVPGVLAMVALAWTPEPSHSTATAPSPGPGEPLPRPLRRALVALTLFAFANATDAFVLVKAVRLGAPPAAAPLLWLALHVVKASLGTVGGRLADAHGRRPALAAGWCVYAVLWGAIGFVESLPVLFVLTALYGTSHGLVEGAERALVADLSAGRSRGTAFGAHAMVIGVASLVASATFGLVWDRFGSGAAFAGSACFALLAAAVLWWWVPARPGHLPVAAAPAGVGYFPRRGETGMGEEAPGEQRQVQQGALTALLREVFAEPASPASSWDAALHPGAVFGRFELLREVGRGGYGSVWEARDTELKRRVAFKAIRTSSRAAADEQALSEAEVAAHLSHPNIVTLHDVGRSEHGVYLVMELLSGRDLGAVVAAGALPAAEAVRIATEVARALAHAHERGVLHRDLTPGNVFVCDGGLVKLLDLGLSGVHGRGEASPSGQAGTPGFTPPERVRGEPEDARSDLYGLGALLHLMLTGTRRAPEDGGAVDVRRIPGPPALGMLVARLLSPDPEGRPGSAAAVREALEEVSAELRGATVTRGERHPPRRRRVLAASAVALFLVVAAVLAGRRPAVRPPPSTITVSTGSPVIAVGQAAPVRAAASTAEGKPAPLGEVSWTSSDPAVASVDGGGTVTGRAPGTASIEATSGGASGSSSVVVSGPEWELVAEHSLATEPAGSIRRNGALGGQGAATVHGRNAWLQTSDWSFLFVPLSLPDDVDVFAVQGDFFLPPVTEWTRSVTFVAFTDPGSQDPADMLHGRGLTIRQDPGGAPRFTWGIPEGWTTAIVEATGTVERPITGAWRTLRIEGSRSQCWLRALLDGVPVHTSARPCDPVGRHVALGSVHGGRNPVDGAWSNLRVFRGVPVAHLELKIVEVHPGFESDAKVQVVMRDARGNRLTGRRVHYASSDPSVASVDEDGRLRFHRRGDVTVTVRSEGVTASAPIHAEPRPAAPP